MSGRFGRSKGPKGGTGVVLREILEVRGDFHGEVRGKVREVWEVRAIFETEYFLSCCFSFLRSNILEQLKWQIEQIIWM